jgi:hypothetical protein
VQYSRALARRTVCQNNLRQLSLAMRSYTETRKRYPDICPPDQAGGWVVSLLPFLEEQTLQDELKARPALTGPDVSPLARKRPAIFTCPNGFEGDSGIAGIPAAHYLLSPPPPESRKSSRFFWAFLEALPTNRAAWAAGPEQSLSYYLEDAGDGRWPHSGGYNCIASSNESCSLVMPSPKAPWAKN